MVRQVMKVCRLPRRPSKILRLKKEYGLSARARLSFDVACIEFDERFQLELDATVEVPLTDEEKRKPYVPTKTEPANTHDQLMAMLGLALDEDGVDGDVKASVMNRAADWFRTGGLSEATP